MSEPGPGDQRETLHLRLDLNLDSRPVTGRLRDDDGFEQDFAGWLGFADALAKARSRTRTSSPGTEPRP